MCWLITFNYVTNSYNPSIRQPWSHLFAFIELTSNTYLYIRPISPVNLKNFATTNHNFFRSHIVSKNNIAYAIHGIVTDSMERAGK